MPEPSNPTGTAMGWLARGAMLLGGVTLALRLGLPAGSVAVADGELDESEEVGRGRPVAPPSRSARGAGHETGDMSGQTMAKLLLLLGSVVAVMVVAMVGFRVFLVAHQDHALPAVTAEQLVQPAPPAPNLQANPMGDIATLHAEENKLLDNYAWVDPAHTHGRIPIGRAMSLIVGHPIATAP
jgi:hypothetical protein